jgi:inositol phosphorylceramide mannosyltransferase catalytic subunit
MIPKIIWQTYKDPYDSLPQYIKNVSKTWIDKNPGYEYVYMDDLEARSFVSNEYGQDWLLIWDSCPLGVMRGDLWRYLIINKYGGVYADLDTICVNPIDSWLKKGYDAVLCLDDDFKSYAQLAFAAVPNHAIFNKVLNLIKQAFIDPNYSNPHFVHDLTGVNIWTKAVKSELNNEYDNVYIYDGEDANIFHERSIKHLVASKNWKTEGYVQWQEEMKKL